MQLGPLFRNNVIVKMLDNLFDDCEHTLIVDIDKLTLANNKAHGIHSFGFTLDGRIFKSRSSYRSWDEKLLLHTTLLDEGHRICKEEDRLRESMKFIDAFFRRCLNLADCSGDVKAILPEIAFNLMNSNAIKYCELGKHRISPEKLTIFLASETKAIAYLKEQVMLNMLLE